MNNFVGEMIQQARNIISKCDSILITAGAGTSIPSIRRMSESAAKQFHTSLIRINPREPQGLHGTIKLPLGGLEGIRHILSR